LPPSLPDPHRNSCPFTFFSLFPGISVQQEPWFGVTAG
jgi:hypothetical protein